MLKKPNLKNTNVNCDLCERIEFRRVLYEDNFVWITIDKKDNIPILVWKEHTIDLDKTQKSYCEAQLVATVLNSYPGRLRKDFRIDENIGSDTKHYHIFCRWIE